MPASSPAAYSLDRHVCLLDEPRPPRRLRSRRRRSGDQFDLVLVDALARRCRSVPSSPGSLRSGRRGRRPRRAPRRTPGAVADGRRTSRRPTLDRWSSAAGASGTAGSNSVASAASGSSISSVIHRSYAGDAANAASVATTGRLSRRTRGLPESVGHLVAHPGSSMDEDVLDARLAARAGRRSDHRDDGGGERSKVAQSGGLREGRRRCTWSRPPGRPAT